MEPVPPVPGHGILFVEKAGGRLSVRPEGSSAELRLMIIFLLEAQLLASTPRALDAGRRKGTDEFKLKIRDDLHPLLVGM